METKNEILEFTSAIKYSFAIRFGAPYSSKDVPNIGIVFGNPQLATLCQEYIDATYDNDELIIEITPGLVTAKIELKEVNSDKEVVVAELNFDKPEIINFKNKTPVNSRLALIFGFKRGCDYYVTGNAEDKAEDFSPIVLAGYSIIQ
ncbi:hypothetical protein BH10BAC2_BH10BAC2_11240 [soil metagenome]